VVSALPLGRGTSAKVASPTPATAGMMPLVHMGTKMPPTQCQADQSRQCGNFPGRTRHQVASTREARHTASLRPTSAHAPLPAVMTSARRLQRGLVCKQDLGGYCALFRRRPVTHVYELLCPPSEVKIVQDMEQVPLPPVPCVFFTLFPDVDVFYIV
jgi:hypothetical protein